MTLQKPDFAVDAMLGNLAKKLRILGYDSKYSSSIEDEELVRLAKDENRVILTKDQNLVKNAEKESVTVVLIRGDDEINQIMQIVTKMSLSDFVMDTNSSRCVDCNGKLLSVDKANIIDNVPRGIYQRQDKFWRCGDCQKIYWEGTHFVKLQEFVSKLNKRLK